MNKISNRTLGIAGMLAAPFLSLEMAVSGEQNTSLGGLCDLVYMTGWMCSILGLLRLGAAGEKRPGRSVLIIQLVLLFIANVWNVWVILDPLNKSTLFLIMDFSWPVSNAFMLITGITVAVKGVLKGWKRWTALAAGCWLPFAILMMNIAGNEFSVTAMNTYSIVAWALLGLTVATSSDRKQQAHTYKIGLE